MQRKKSEGKGEMGELKGEEKEEGDWRISRRNNINNSSGWGTHVYLWQIHFDIWQI